jgi:hypothetical protein
LNVDAGVFWVLMRVLASGGLGVLVWEGYTGQLAKRRDIEVCHDLAFECFHEPCIIVVVIRRCINAPVRAVWVSFRCFV